MFNILSDILNMLKDIKLVLINLLSFRSACYNTTTNINYNRQEEEEEEEEEQEDD